MEACTRVLVRLFPRGVAAMEFFILTAITVLVLAAWFRVRERLGFGS